MGYFCVTEEDKTYILEELSMLDKIAVLIPCYNESKSIAKVVHDMKRICRKQRFMCTIIIRQTEQIRLPEKPVQ